jgi:peptidoglycan/xylan/chitin deacetylase (PgdA/CDA1 family)
MDGSRFVLGAAAMLTAGLLGGPASAACDANVLGTSRTLTLPREGAAYGTAQHGPLPLAPGEVVITFDDGPRPESTPRVLQALKAQCVRATFFMVGEPLLAHRELARQVRDEGHSVGMHGFRHLFFNQEPEARQLADLQQVQQAYQEVFGAEAAAYRFPYLAETPVLMAALKERRITVMSVDVGIEDWVPVDSPQVLADRMAERLAKSGGGILLLHDAQDQTSEALPLLLQTLKAKGYRVVHLAWE